MSETPTNVTPPPDLTYGYVDGRIILAIGDRSDAGRMPDPVPADDTTVTFTPANTILKVTTPTPATVIKQPIVCAVDANGYLVDGQGARGVWLVTGTYKVTYSHSRAIIPSHDIEVTTGHTEVAPLDLTTAMPPGGPVLAPSEYAELNGRLAILEAGGGVTWSTISDKPAVVAEGATQADARTAIGAGTSSFSGAYADLSGKPTTMTPAAHASTHEYDGSDPLAITDLGVGSLADGQMLVRSGSALVGQAVPSPLTGTGFPEGVIAASVGAEYVDTAATNGAWRWLKTAGTGNTGWVVTYGDTGPRDLSALLTNGAATGGAPAPTGGSEQSILRRSGNVVTFTPKIAVTGWTNGHAFITIPTGFRPTEAAMYLSPAYAGSPGQCILTGTGDVLLYDPPAATPGIRWSWTWHTSDPWPTTLPGTPA